MAAPHASTGSAGPLTATTRSTTLAASAPHTPVVSMPGTCEVTSPVDTVPGLPSEAPNTSGSWLVMPAAPPVTSAAAGAPERNTRPPPPPPPGPWRSPG